MKTKNSIKKPFLINGYKIKWSKIYKKWQVCRGKIILEEFNYKKDARFFAKNN
jgi:hypothetical protein